MTEDKIVLKLRRERERNLRNSRLYYLRHREAVLAKAKEYARTHQKQIRARYKLKQRLKRR